MQYKRYVGAIEQHSAGVLAAATAAGPDASVPTCPRWDVRRLIGHFGRVQSWVVSAIAHPDGDGVTRATPPDDWPELLAWSEAQSTALTGALAGGPDRPAWIPFPVAGTTGSWARRQAHEAAIHHLDAEHAAGQPTVMFDPDFAGDGIDEFLTVLLRHPNRDFSEQTAAGTVLIEATDIGRRWVAVAAPGVAPSVQPEAGVRTADLTISGEADAVYRAMWARPHAARVAGDTTLLEPLRAP